LYPLLLLSLAVTTVLSAGNMTSRAAAPKVISCASW